MYEDRNPQWGVFVWGSIMVLVWIAAIMSFVWGW